MKSPLLISLLQFEHLYAAFICYLFQGQDAQDIYPANAACVTKNLVAVHAVTGSWLAAMLCYESTNLW